MESAKRSAQQRYNELRRRRVLKVPDATKPLFVAAAQYKPSRFSWGKPCLLVVTATAVVLLDVQNQGELEAKDGSHASIQLAVRASEVFDMLLAGGNALRLEYKGPGTLKVSPAVFGFGTSAQAAPSAPAAFSAAAGTRSAGGGGGSGGLGPAAAAALDAAVSFTTASSGGAGGAGGAGGGAGRGEVVHSEEHCTLQFEDADALRGAAAAIAYARAADADALRWVACGLPTSFAIDLVCAVFEPPPRPAAPPAPPAPAALAPGAAAAAGPGPWGGAVALPRAWRELLSRAAAAGEGMTAARAASLSRALSAFGPFAAAAAGPAAPLARRWSGALDVLSGLAPAQSSGGAAGAPRRAAGAAAGPGALVVYFSTPLGLAAARVRLEHLLALQRDTRLDSVLAIPVGAAALSGAAGGGGSGGGSGHGSAGGSLHGSSGARSAGGGGGGGGGGGSGGAGAAAEPCFQQRVVASLLTRKEAKEAAAAGGTGGGSAHGGRAGSPVRAERAGADWEGSGGGGGSGAGLVSAGPSVAAVEVSHSQGVYAVLHIGLVRRDGPGDDGTAADGTAEAAAAKAEARAALRKRAEEEEQAQQHAAAKSRGSGEAGAPERPPPSELWPAFVAVLFSLLLQAALTSPGALSWRVALAAAALSLSAALAITRTQSLLSARRARALAGAGGPPATPVPPPSLAPLPAATAAVTAVAAPEAEVEGWSLVISGASLVTQPDAYVQAQIKDYKCAAVAAAAAAAAAASDADADAAPASAAAPAASELAAAAKRVRGAAARETLDEFLPAEEAPPTLISDPEPAWLTPDTHRRFIQAKSTLKASRDQAMLTHKWRQRLNVDSILERPPGSWWEFVTENFRAHLIQVTPDGDPVLLVKLSDAKRLGDAIRAGKGSLSDLEQHLAFINEYQYKVAAPHPIPGGMCVQIIDCAGARLSMITSDAIAVFASFGLYYPERMNKALVINAPSWFDMPWRIAYNILDENTRSKVVLEFNQKKVQEALDEVLGPENVPAEYGGPCTTPYDELPASKALFGFVAELRAGGNPYARVAAETPQP